MSSDSQAAAASEKQVAPPTTGAWRQYKAVPHRLRVLMATRNPATKPVDNLVVYPIIYRVYKSRVVGNGISEPSIVVGGWTNPIEQYAAYAQVKLDHVLKDRGWK